MQEDDEDVISTSVKICTPEGQKRVMATGNGRLDAVANALREYTGAHFVLESYHQNALEHESSSRAACYVGLRWADGKTSWGAGTDTDIIRAGIKAFASAFNNGFQKEEQ
jgi:2-isopropylmalate synthase